MKKQILIFAFSLVAVSARCEIGAVWLTYNTNAPTGIVLNWTTSSPSAASVDYGTTESRGAKINSADKKTLHYAEIPISNAESEIFYKISDDTGAEFSAKINRLPASENFRAVIIGNLGYAKNPDFRAIEADRPDIVFTCGDNVPMLHENGKWDGSMKPFEAAIKKFPRRLLASTPLMPISGNHDKEIRPRGKKYPKEASYDPSAAGFKEFFKLPDGGSYWKFAVPQYGVTFLGIDVCHIYDYGTTWQACSPFGADSRQYVWYKGQVENRQTPFVFTLMNERNQDMRKTKGKIWEAEFSKTSGVVSGFGYYLERAETGGVKFYNTSLNAGDKYPDAFSKFIKAEGGYLLLTFAKGKDVRADLKSLAGEVLDSSAIKPLSSR
jgi:hypothetical protein